MDLSATYEYVVSPRKQAKWKWKRVGMIALYIVYVITLLAVGIRARLLIPLLTFVPLSTWILIWLTWRYVSVEYEYSLTGGVMTLSRILGGRSRKTEAEIRIKEMHMIAPFEGEYIKQAEAYAPERTIDFTADLQHPDVFFALYETSEGRRGILYFEATDQALKILKYYNSATVVRRASL